jgi:hypothetical protein
MFNIAASGISVAASYNHIFDASRLALKLHQCEGTNSEYW